ncbi:MAG: hypothetical protein ABW123_07395 [Cystobacter sp.]
MGSTYLHFSDEELLERIARLSGDVTLVRAQNKETGAFCIGLCEQEAGSFLPLSSHTDEDVAKQAGLELATRLERLAARQPTLRLRFIQ